MTLQIDYDYYKRGIMNRVDQDSSSYGTLASYGSRGAMVQAGVEREAILKVISNLKFERGIDVGCGPGRYLTLVARQRDVVGLDISTNMAWAAKETVKQSDIVLADMESIPFRDGSFELVYSIRAMKYLRSQARFLREAQRVCSPTGCILLYDIWNAKNVGYLLSETCLRFISMLQSCDFPREMRRMDHLSIKFDARAEGRVQRSRQRHSISPPDNVCPNIVGTNSENIHNCRESAFLRFPFSEYFAFELSADHLSKLSCPCAGGDSEVFM